MVRVRDDGVFDAPLEKIWRFLQDTTHGTHEHRTIRATRVLDQKGNVVTQEAEVLNPDGKGTHKESWKFVMNPPKGWDMEYLDGPMKGTRHAHTYTSMGDRTKVEVDGEFHIHGMDDESTKRAILDYFAEVFQEDSNSLKKYR